MGLRWFPPESSPRLVTKNTVPENQQSLLETNAASLKATEVIGSIAAVVQLCSTVAGYISSARGASDAKGQLLHYIHKCQAMLERLDRKPNNTAHVKDGETKSGSSSNLDFQ
jgi:hypothetical protein